MRNLKKLSQTKISVLYIATLWTLAISHPLYDLLTKEDHTTFFVAHQSKPIDILIFVFVFSFVIPFTIYLVLLLIKKISRPGALGLYTSVLFSLFVLIFLPIFDRLFGEGIEALSFVFTLSASTAATIFTVSTTWFGTFLSIMSLAIIASPLMFLMNPDVRSRLSIPDAKDEMALQTKKSLPNIVLVIFDELPLFSILDDDYLIDKALYPNFARLAETSTWFRNAATAYSSTRKAIPAILTGTYTKTIRDRIVGKDQIPDNLLTFFENYYQIKAVESVTEFVTSSPGKDTFLPGLNERMSTTFLDSFIMVSHTILPPVLSHYLPSIDGQWRDFTSINTSGRKLSDQWPYIGSKPEEIRNFLSLIRRTNRPTLFFLHSALPHFPYIYNEDGSQNGSQVNRLGGGAKGIDQDRFAKNRETSALVHQAHLLQVRFVDRLLGLILDKLQSQEIFEDALIIVTADHGASFIWGEGLSKTEMARAREEEIVFIPLLIKSPKQDSPVLSDRPVLSIDVLPTIMDILSIEIPWKVEGESALDNSPLDRKRYAYVPSRVEISEIFPSNSLAISAKFELFGSGSLEKLYAFGPHQELLNTKVDEFEQRSSTIEFTPKSNYDRIYMGTVKPPFYIEGTLSNFSPATTLPDFKLAIAINGIIRGTMRAFEENEKISFLTRIPPESWLEGESNEVTIHGIIEDLNGNVVALSRITNAND